MLAGTYLLYAAVMVWAHPQFIYPFGADPFDDPRFEQSVVTDSQVPLAIHRGDEDLAVLFFMGNGGALGYFTFTLDAHVRAGRTLVALEYPGGGGIPGNPSEQGLKTDALAAYDWLSAEHDGPIVVHGFSLGTGLAVHVAAQRPVAGVILDAPYAQLCRLMTRASYLPACYMPGVQKWDSARLARDVTAPIVVQHGTADQLIPMGEGQRLVDILQAAGAPVTYHAVDGATHNNLAGQPGYADRIDAFIASIDK